MKHLDEYRDVDRVRAIAAEIARVATKPWTLMEVCGGQTHAIVRHGLDTLLPSGIELLHGPGCPVCVTALETIDRAHAIAARPNVVFCSFGDMLRVPGSRGDLLARKAEGADVRVVYSPLDAVALAQRLPDKEVVFFAIGFETTAPATATAAIVAKRRGVNNFSMLVSHVLVPPVVSALLGAKDNRVQAMLGPGHVCTVMGVGEYLPISAAHHVPIVITGFEPVDLLRGVLSAVQQLEDGRAEVENPYARVVRTAGNERAQAALAEAFEVCDRAWRGIGVVPASGYRLNAAFADFDAEKRFDVSGVTAVEPAVCVSGEVLRGVKKPHQCPAFGKECTPEHPLGATMVSSEGACAAYHAYRRRLPIVGTAP